MPKLPANYVKPPSFDNPLRATTGIKAIAERILSLSLDEGTWKSLQAASEAAGVSAEAFAIEALQRHLSLVEQKAIAPQVVELSGPPVSKRAQLLDQLYGQFVKRSWVQCVMTVRALVRERRVSS